MQAVIIMAILMLVLIAFKIPIAVALGASSFLYLLLNPGDTSLFGLQDRMLTGVYQYQFLAVPYFILAGRIFNHSGVTERIFDFAMSLVGHIKGGMGHVNILASMIFAGMSGAATADAAGLGLIEIKAMKDAGYPSEFSACITAASATIGPIIPPSITLVLYGVLAQTSIGRLFIGGLLPGVLMGIALMLIVFIIAYLSDDPCFETGDKPNISNIWFTFKRAFLSLWAPIIILGGIVLGVITPTEAGIVAIVYALFLGVFYGNIRLGDFKEIAIETSIQTGAVMFILAGARMFSYIMTINRVPMIITESITAFTESPMVLLLLLNIGLLIMGMFINSSTILVMTVPILTPLLLEFGIDLVHFGVVMTLNVMIGMITPPLGVTLYISSDIAEVEFEKTLKQIIPFWIPLVAVLLLITYFPNLVMWLPNMLM